MKTINIKGKEYITVNERLKAFRNEFKDYSLIGRIVDRTPDSIVFEAQIIDNKGIVRANGFARETTQKGGVNKFAMLENAETSAWGRALGNFGIGIDEAICTADELESKLEYEDAAPKQPAPETPPTPKQKTLEERIEDFKKYIGATTLEDMNSEKYKKAFNALCKLAGPEKAEELTNIHNNRFQFLMQQPLEKK